MNRIDWLLSPVSRDKRKKMKIDCGIPDTPTHLTYHLRSAVNGEGEYASMWIDKPHRLLYTACREIERLDAIIKNLSLIMIFVVLILIFI